MTPFFIGLCGGKFGQGQVGKTTAAQILQDELGFHIADLMTGPLVMAKAVGKWETIPAPKRLLLIDKICQSGRASYRDIWLHLALSNVPKGKSRVVLDNMYFADEAEFIQSHGGRVVHIVRPPLPVPSFSFSPDLTVLNDQDLSTLRLRLLGCIKPMLQD